MNDEQDTELKARFAALRENEREGAPAWHPRYLRAPQPESGFALKWAFAAVLAVAGTFWLLRPQQASWADFPPLLENDAAPLFASLEPVSTDFLLPAHLTIDLP